MKRINLPLPVDLLGEVDDVRGDVPRTVWIRHAIEAALLADWWGDLTNVERDDYLAFRSTAQALAHGGR